MGPPLTAKRFILLFQLFGTLGIILFIDNTVLATALLILWWIVTFYPLSKKEYLLFFLTCIIFTGVDVMVLKQGVFQFSDQDVWGMPYYEPFMWGFYFLNAHRILGGDTPRHILPGLLFALLVMSALSFIPHVQYALITTGALLLIALAFFRTKQDVAYAAYLLIIGVLIEFLGTKSGEWSYNIDVPVLWWIVTWAVSGLILYRTVLPITALILRRFETKIL